MSSFSELAKHYDAIYYKAEVYETESRLVSRLIEKHNLSPNRNMLDVACGTGAHIKFFLGKYQVFGLDLSGDMLAVAREQYPNVDLYNLSMIDFDIDVRFGSIICLYGSIGFV
ncbi:class I SAM-dependent DNA methyltransferase [Candidatus Hydrogenedentota bacterium]